MAELPARPNAAASVLSSRGGRGRKKAGEGGGTASWTRSCLEARTRPGPRPDRTGAQVGAKGAKGKRKLPVHKGVAAPAKVMQKSPEHARMAGDTLRTLSPGA